MRGFRPLGFLAAWVAILTPALLAWAHGHGGGQEQPAPQKQAPRAPIRTTMEALHRTGGVPPGWKFLLPSGNAAAGRKVFVDLGCDSCHEVKGEQFPTKSGEKQDAGPELTGVGSVHPAEYFAEAILNPNRVIVEGPGFTGPDGLSKMPTFNEDMTVAQLIDLVAYLKSLTAGGHQPAPSSSTPTPKKEAPTGGHRMH